MILLDHGPGGLTLFDGPREVVAAWEPAEVVPALARLDAARAEGLWVAGAIAFEAASAFEPRLSSLKRGPGPLLAFGVYEAPAEPPSWDPPAPAPARLTAPAPAIAREAYDEAIARVLAFIAAGDCYQVNLTFPLRARLTGRPLDLWRRLHAAGPVAHGAYLDLGVGPTLASLSPELFFRVEPPRDGVSRIVTRPMKGTAPRDPDPGIDAGLAVALQESPKARAENLMIVDLLRNDIGRISRTGSVRVPDLYRIEPYATVHQMTSTVTGELAEPASLSRLIPALFPCGSVTGAPKIRAVEIIDALEPMSRGAYCGAIGWMGPDGACAFSVAIRTLSIEGDAVTVGVGGGIVADSTAEGEWEEALWKARFLAPAVG